MLPRGANPSLHGTDGIGAMEDGTGVLSLRTSQRSTQSMLGGATHGEVIMVHLTGLLTDGEIHGLITPCGRVMDGVLILLNRLHLLLHLL